MNRPGFSYVTPVVFVRDLIASLEYYEKVLGFDRKWRWSEDHTFDETEHPTFACVARGDYGLFLAQKTTVAEGGLIGLSVRTEADLETLYREFKACGARIVEPPQDRPAWGMRDMVVQDLDGNTFRIGLPIESARLQRSA